LQKWGLQFFIGKWKMPSEQVAWDEENLSITFTHFSRLGVFSRTRYLSISGVMETFHYTKFVYLDEYIKS
jgi:hypothetical protein